MLEDFVCLSAVRPALVGYRNYTCIVRTDQERAATLAGAGEQTQIYSEVQSELYCNCFGPTNVEILVWTNSETGSPFPNGPM